MKWSVSKIVFLLVALALVSAFLFEVEAGVIVLESKDFVGLATLVFSFYFFKPAPTPEEIATGTEK